MRRMVSIPSEPTGVAPAREMQGRKARGIKKVRPDNNIADICFRRDKARYGRGERCLTTRLIRLIRSLLPFLSLWSIALPVKAQTRSA